MLDLAFARHRLSRIIQSVRTAATLLSEGELREIWRRIRRHPHASLRQHVLARNPIGALGSGRLEIVPKSVVSRSVEQFRTLLFTPTLNLEGAPLSQLELTRGLMERHVIEPEVVSFQDGPLREHYQHMRCPVRVLKPMLHKIPTLKCYEAEVNKLADFIRESSPGLVYANTLLNFPIIAAASRAGVPSIWNVREGEPPESYFDFLSNAVAASAVDCFSLANRVVFVAQAAADRWADFNLRDNFAVIRNAIARRGSSQIIDVSKRSAMRRTLGVASDETVVLNIGTVCERKGQRDLIAAITRLPPEMQMRTRVICVGDERGSYSKMLKKDIAMLPPEVGANVSLTPTLSDVEPYFRAADVFVLTSYHEGYPRVLLEAMDYGLSIVSTRIGGVEEQVKEGYNALLYMAGDVEALSRHLATILSDEAFRQRMGRASLKVLDRLPTFEQMRDAYARKFREAYAGRSGG